MGTRPSVARLMDVATQPKPAGRIAVESPYLEAHERTARARLRHPQRLGQYLHELRVAWEDETVTRLHTMAVDDSVLGSPRWTRAFLDYLNGGDCDTIDGEYRWPMRSSLFRMSTSTSGKDQLASGYVWLLCHHGFDVRRAWAHQCGPFADRAISEVADTWAMEALYRWWGRYIERPMRHAA